MKTLFSTLFAVVVLAVSAACVFIAAQSAPDAPLCVIPNGSTGFVNLTVINAATYNANLATTSGLRAVKINMGWCKQLPVSTSCNNETGLSMTITDAASNLCIASFSAIAAPGAQLSNTSYNIAEWSADSGMIASVTVNCDSSVPAGTAVFTGVIANVPSYQYVLNFNSSVACGTSFSQKKNGVLRGLGH